MPAPWMGYYHLLKWGEGFKQGQEEGSEEREGRKVEAGRGRLQAGQSKFKCICQ